MGKRIKISLGRFSLILLFVLFGITLLVPVSTSSPTVLALTGSLRFTIESALYSRISDQLVSKELLEHGRLDTPRVLESYVEYVHSNFKYFHDIAPQEVHLYDSSPLVTLVEGHASCDQQALIVATLLSFRDLALDYRFVDFEGHTTLLILSGNDAWIADASFNKLIPVRIESGRLEVKGLSAPYNKLSSVRYTFGVGPSISNIRTHTQGRVILWRLGKIISKYPRILGYMIEIYSYLGNAEFNNLKKNGRLARGETFRALDPVELSLRLHRLGN